MEVKEMCDNTSSQALSMKTMHMARMMRMLHEERMREADPRASPGRVLALLRLSGGATVGDMAMVLEARPGSLEKTLGRLVEEGLAVREAGEKKWLDTVKPTEKGMQPCARPRGRMEKVFETLTDAECEQFATVMDKLNAVLEQDLGIPSDPEERREFMRRRAGG